MLRRGVVLGLLIAVGAFAVDLYIPAFAAIADELHASPGDVQLSMTSYFLAVAAGQLVYGPVSDAIGRRRPIFAGLAVFAAGSVWAASAGSIEGLVAARLLQGFGAAATAVLPLAAISDEYAGPDAARLLSIAILSLSVSPIVAPSAGGLMVEWSSWRLIFAALAVVAVAAAVMVARLLPETLPPGRRTPLGLRRTAATYAGLLGDRRFVVPLLIAGFADSVLLAFVSGSPFVFVSLHGLTPAAYGALFALHAAALIGTSQLNAPLMRRFGVRRLLAAGTLAAAGAGGLLAALVAGGMTSLAPFAALSVTVFAALGAVLPTAFLAATEPFAATAGAAAALGVAGELGMSTAATLLLSRTQDGTARPMTFLMAAAAAGSLAACAAFVRAPRRAAPASAGL